MCRMCMYVYNVQIACLCACPMWDFRLKKNISMLKPVNHMYCTSRISSFSHWTHLKQGCNWWCFYYNWFIVCLFCPTSSSQPKSNSPCQLERGGVWSVISSSDPQPWSHQQQPCSETDRRAMKRAFSLLQSLAFWQTWLDSIPHAALITHPEWYHKHPQYNDIYTHTHKGGTTTTFTVCSLLSTLNGIHT